MNVHSPHPATKADRIRKAAAAHPDLSSAQIGQMLGVSSEYVRATMQRSRSRTTKGRLATALALTQKAYLDCIQLRRECEINPRSAELSGRYQRAWDVHSAAEKAFLELEKPDGYVRIPEIDPRRIRGVDVRSLLRARGL